MRSEVWKKYQVLLIALATAVVLTGCGGQDTPQTKTGPSAPEDSAKPGWEHYIHQHTSGLIGKTSALRIRFVNDVVPREQVGQPVRDILKTDPRIPGEAMFESPRELVFVPSENLKSGQTYQVSLLTQGLKGFPPDREEYTFEFNVIRQDFELTVIGLNLEPDDNKQMVLKGALETADVEEADLVEKMLSAEYLGKDLPISWQPDNTGKRYAFTIAGISRQDQTRQLKLSWDGTPIGVDNRGTREIEVPAVGLFKVTRVRSVQGDKQSIQILFSDRLSPKQNRRGLIRLDSGSFSMRAEGNAMEVFPEGQVSGEITVTIDGAVKNAAGFPLEKPVTETVTFLAEKPQVRFVGKGVIMPDNDRLTIPFEAINVHSVQVAAFRVFNNNLGQFLQANNLDGNTNLGTVGRYLWRKSVPLSDVTRDKWNRYLLDATELLQGEPGSLYRLTLSINRSNSIYECSEEENAVPVVGEEPLANQESPNLVERSSWDYAENDYNSDQSNNWNDRRNPCKDPYYRHAEGISDSRNFVASNIGLIAKQGTDGKIRIVATDLRRAEPLGQVAVTLYNFQNQPIAHGKSDGKGLAELAADSTPFYLVAEKGRQKGYLKLNAGNVLPVSHFDVAGQTVQRGVKGHLYGERGVWRPGDDIHLTFVLQDKDNAIPANHPVTLELFNPRGQLMQTLTNTTPVGDFYTFELKTSEEDITGNWTAKARLGGMTFTKTLKIETVVPNRLKVELDLKDDQALYKSAMPLDTRLFAQWLHGATASDLKADVKVRLTPRATRFGRFQDYVFDDPAREFAGESQTLFEGKLDREGYASFEKDLLFDSKPPGMLTANFTSRVFEEGGAFSTSTQAVPFHPYEYYLGIKLPKGDPARGMLLTDTRHKVEIASLDAKGEPSSVDKVKVTLYKIAWKWWWDKSGESLANYASAESTQALQEGDVSTRNGRGNWEFEIKYPDWGRYLVRACDENGDHCTGKVFYVDWPGWAGRAQEERGAGANALTLYTDKKSYRTGETAVVNLPPAKQGRALVSIENGTGILDQYWLELAEGQTQFKLPLTAEMSPNVYVSVTLVQPHADRENDRPIRLYGVVPISVDDPQTRLDPVIEAADELAPESTVEVKISEKDGRAMTYTLALVDEGLLGLTNFRTPDLHGAFYRKEALGVKTWDMFDEVVGAYDGKLERLLALGGDEDLAGEKPQQKQRRFPPVVRFLGPFRLDAGKRASHRIDLPQYVGAVRLMTVAGQEGAYGRAEKTALVRQPLTLLATLPRVLGPTEALRVPVSVFVMDKSIKNVDLSVVVDDHFEVVGPEHVQVRFDGSGDQLGFLTLKAAQKPGTGTIRFKAVSGKHQAEQTISLQVRSPNQPTLRGQKEAIAANDKWQTELKPHGLPGTNKVFLELSMVPPLNLDHRLRYLIHYPHGCIEQTTSSVFPQLYLPDLIDLDKSKRDEIANNVQAGIERLRQFQQAGGGFSYWPGSGEVNAWGTNYAGHFLLEAKRLGYQVPAKMLADWTAYQKSAAQAWTAGGDRSTLDQAYRLYTLVLAQSPELGAMNRLRESSGLDNMGRWQLAAAYQQMGLADAARELTHQAALKVAWYERPGATFGSELRDRAILLDCLALMKNDLRAKEVADLISGELSSSKWLSTQSTAYALMAMARFVGAGGGIGEKARFTWRIGDGPIQEATLVKPIFRTELADFPETGAPVEIVNPNGRTLYANLTAEGIPAVGNEQASSEGLALKVSFSDLKGRAVAPGNLQQGSDFQAEVAVRNLTERDLENLALTQVVPSGWQIHNARFEGESANSEIDYQDVRDDRLLTYFSLKAGQEKSFKVLLNASFLGRYYLPAWSVEAMYNAARQARTTGQWVTIEKHEE
jgi:uncharacterized protein YfaS (alpha-2-macroglobulin family)